LTIKFNVLEINSVYAFFVANDQQIKRTNKQPCSGATIMKNLLSRFANDESGATAIEYGLIAALVSVVIIVALGFLGDELTGTFNDITAALKERG
jgi:pilus assembly protein Flp/PilA